MPLTPHCAQCKKPVGGRILRYGGANCCVPCYVRLEGTQPPSDEELASLEKERRAQALVAVDRRKELLRMANGPRPQRKDYKILTQFDGFFSGQFHPAKIEAAVNHYAAQGWCVVSMATAVVPGVLNSGEQLIILMERDHIPVD